MKRGEYWRSHEECQQKGKESQEVGAGILKWGLDGGTHKGRDVENKDDEGRKEL